MSNALLKVQALIARATDAGASEEEARTSAVLALRLMAKYGLTIGGACTHARSWTPPQEAPKAQEAPRAEPKAQEAPKSGPRRKWYGKPRRVELDAKFAGECAHCGARYAVGDRISWKRGDATYHAACAVECEAA